MLKAVFFDMDGTIGDSLPLCLAAFKNALDPLAGKSFSNEEIMAAFGPTEEGTIKILVPDHVEEGIQSYYHHYKRLRSTCAEPFPGIPQILQKLKDRGILVVIVTGKGQQFCKMDIDCYGIGQWIDYVETGSPLGLRKSEAIQDCLKHYHLLPQETIYVGDSPKDIIHARAVGVDTIAALWGSVTDEDAIIDQKPVVICHSVQELDQYLHQLMHKSI